MHATDMDTSPVTRSRGRLDGDGWCLAISDRALDWGERSLVLSFYGILVARLVAEGRRVDLILLASEGLVIVFVLLGRPALAISRLPADWLIAGASICLPMLARPVVDRSATSGVATRLGLGLLILGLMIQVLAKLTLRRSFGCVPAHRGLVFDGPYRVVRHPMYSGYLAGHVGYFLANPSAWNLGVYLGCYACQVRRILAEERLLDADPRYRDFRDQVPARLIPGIF